MVQPIPAIASDSTVAKAAPKTPKWNVIINIKSSAIFKKLEIIKKISGVLASPSALNIEETPL